MAAMRDIFLEGLPILDALEVSGSTAAAALWMNCDQSSISRSYRRVSQQLDLAFNKDDGSYQASNNLQVLASLRHASQLRRLAGGAGHLQWMCHRDLKLPALSAPLRPPLSCSARPRPRCVDLLRRQVLDMAVVPAVALAQGIDQSITSVSLTAEADSAALVLAELRHHPSVEALLVHLQQQLSQR